MFKTGRKSYNRYKLIINSVFLVSLTSVLFVYPFGSHFRFTLGVAVLSTSLLYFPQLPIISTASWSSLGIFFTRMAIDVFIGSYGWTTAILQTLPAVAYYICFGICFYFLRIRSSISNALAVVFKVSLSDLVCNLLEITIRHDFMLSDSVMILPELAGAAIFRAVIVVYGYYLLKRYRVFILAEEHLIRYTQLILVFADLKTELFYLKKSSQDMESVMERSYLLYQKLTASPAKKDDAAGGEALSIARDIHEIEKDYYRVISGIEKILIPSDNEQGMRLSEIFYIIEQNTTRFLTANHKNIITAFIRESDFITDKHYMIVSLLNNLIINAIEACTAGGSIKVTQLRRDNNILFNVEDNGQGIAEKDLALIFNPGFSTKYSETTGKMSTGLGLAHVKTLTEMMGGCITVKSEPEMGTVFTITIPFEKVSKK